jgi:peptide/nickel transport system substrate-binding protein
VGPQQAADHPIGTGPFKFTQWDKDQRVVFDAFDGYWGGRPKVDQLIFRSIPEPTTRIAELLSGNVHLTYGLSFDQANDLDQKPGVKAVIADSTRVEMVVLDTTRQSQLTDVRVRQALNYAIDKDALLKAFFGGHGHPVGQPVTPPMLGYNPDVTPYPYDANMARQLLAQAGYPNGFSIDFESDQTHKDLSEAIAAQLAKVGVNAQLQEFDNTVENQRFNSHTLAPMFFNVWLGVTADAEGTLTPRLSTGAHNSWFSDADVDKQIRAGASSINADERKQVYMPLMAELKDKAPWLYLWQGVDVYGASDKLTGWSPRPDTYIILKDAALAD